MTWLSTPLVYVRRAHQETIVPSIDQIIRDFTSPEGGYREHPLTTEETVILVREVKRLREAEQAGVGPYSPAEIDTLLGVRNCLDRFVEILEAQQVLTTAASLQLRPPVPPLLTQVLTMKSHLSAMMEAIRERNSHTTTHDNEGHTP